MKLRILCRNWIFQGLLLFNVLFGTLATCVGTYAWFEYSTRASTSYRGSAIGFDGGLLIGLISEVKNEDLSNKYDLIEDAESLPGEFIYWSSVGLDFQMIECYNQKRGYSVNMLSPVSSRKFETDDDFSLYEAPSYLHNSKVGEANKSYYSNLRVSFREASYPGTRSQLCLEAFTLDCTNDMRNAVRISFDSIHDDKTFIYAPSETKDGYDDVAGVLDLNKDSYYDSSDGKYEYIYGEYDNPTPSTYYEVDTKEEGELSTYTAIHRKDTYGMNFDPKHANYLGTNTVIDNRYTIMEPSFEDYINELDINIYIEGWDKSCIEKGIGSYFSLYMTFCC